jgi:coenzyme F420-0:L-glutamate ligase/coenzyme F420-1:gamma-L-glutamate ligase
LAKKIAPIQIFPVAGLPEIKAGDHLANLIVSACAKRNLRIAKGDIFVIAHKIVSKAEGRMIYLDSVAPSEQAIQWARPFQKDPRLVQLILNESARIVRMDRGVIISETRHGFVCANAGVDSSNVPEGHAVLLPEDPDASARSLQKTLTKAFAASIGVIISDTFGRPWREGIVNVALGVAGTIAIEDYRGKRDTAGKTMTATLIARADEIASAAELVMGKTDGVPVALVRGVTRTSNRGTGRDLIRPAGKDLFR